MFKKRLFLLGLTFLTAASVCDAATIVLKDGTKRYGFLIEERSDSVVIRKGGKDIVIPNEQISSIETAPPGETVDLYKQIMSFYNDNTSQVFTNNSQQEYAQPTDTIQEEQAQSPELDSYAGLDGGVYHGLSEIESTAREAEQELERLRDEVKTQHGISSVDDFAVDTNNDVVADIHQQNQMLDVLESVGYEVNDLRNAINTYSTPIEDPFSK